MTRSSAKPGETKPALTPKLRFPEFQKEGGWILRELGKLFSQREEGGRDDLRLLSLMDKEGIIPQEESNRKNNASVDRSRYLRVVPGDIAYNTMRMWEGRSARATIEGVVSPAYTVCEPSEGTNSFFFAYCFKTPQLISQFVRYSQGLVKDTLNLKFEAFSRILAATPSPAEQQKIAECLSTLDEVIGAESQKLDALKAHKKGLMQRLFPREGETLPRLRFPEFRGQWEATQLENLCQGIYSGRDKNDSDGEFALYGSTGIIGKTAAPSHSGQHILVARVGANAGLLNKADGEFGVTDNTLVIATKPSIDLDFIFHYLRNVELNRLIFGSGQPLITGSILKELPVLIPVDSEQRKIAACLSSLDEVIAAQSDKLSALRTHKQGLMQQLFPSPAETEA